MLGRHSFLAAISAALIPMGHANAQIEPSAQQDKYTNCLLKLSFFGNVLKSAQSSDEEISSVTAMSASFFLAAVFHSQMTERELYRYLLTIELASEGMSFVVGKEPVTSEQWNMWQDAINSDCVDSGLLDAARSDVLSDRLFESTRQSLGIEHSRQEFTENLGEYIKELASKYE